MKHYCPTGRRNHGGPMKILLDTWDRNGSTGDQTAWQICDDDDDDDHDDDHDDVTHTHTQTHKINAQIAKDLKWSWIQHVNRMPRNRLPRVMKRYCQTGRRNHGGPMKILLDTWDRNGSTSGPTAWQIYDDDELARPNLFGCFATYITSFQKGILSFRLSAYRLSFKVEAVGHFTWLRPVHATPTQSLRIPATCTRISLYVHCACVQFSDVTAALSRWRVETEYLSVPLILNAMV